MPCPSFSFFSFPVIYTDNIHVFFSLAISASGFPELCLQDTNRCEIEAMAALSQARLFSLIRVFLGKLMGNYLFIGGAATLGLSLVCVVRVLHSWHRLRHIKGPPLAGFSNLWLVRAVTGGNTNWLLANVNRQYGMLREFLVTSPRCWNHVPLFSAPHFAPPA